MNIDRVKYNKSRPYIEYIYQNGKRKGKIYKIFGVIFKCNNCKNESFTPYCDFVEYKKHFCSKECANQMENNPKWKGGVKHNKGYKYIKTSLHPNNVAGYIREHRIIIEKIIGRYLHRFEIVHHINKIKDDNRIENLMVFNNSGAHSKYEIGKDVDKKYIVFDGRVAVNSINQATLTKGVL